LKRLLAALLLAASPLASAESLFVIEQLVVGVNDAPGETGQRIAQVRSGDRVELLERLDGEARVRLDNGTEGWMQAAYLSAELPLRRQLADRSHDLEAARAELAGSRAELEAARADAVTAPASAAQPQSAALLPAERPLFPPRPALDTRVPLPWVAVACALALLAGFTIGWRVLDRRIRRKYGGLRIY
jgi:uncharacterized protein YgiM (DUF1202 family)